MPDDILSMYAQSQPDKPGVIDDRPDGTVVTWTYAELEAQANRVANLLLSLGAVSCKAKFDPHTQKVQIASPSFGPDLIECLQDYRRIERGVWKLPSSVIPQADQGINEGDKSTKKLLMQPSDARYADYTKTPTLIYQEWPEKLAKWQSYDRVPKRAYMPKPLQLEEQSEEEDSS